MVIWWFPFTAASHLQAKGLDEGDASRLASAFSKMGINDGAAVDVSGMAVGTGFPW